MYKYHRPDATLEVIFAFRPARNRKLIQLNTPDARPDYDGHLAINLTIGLNKYGPFSTGIKTFRHVWEGRAFENPKLESRELTKQLVNYQARLEAAHEELLKMEQPIDGKAIMEALKGGRVTLMRVYEEFMTARHYALEPNRKKRTCDQIAPATYETYPKRWEFIHGYLVHVGKVNMPIQGILSPFANGLKEWLGRQRKPDGDRYKPATINKVISLLKQLMRYAVDKGYVGFNPVRDFACRGGSVVNPKPLTKEQLDDLETCPLPTQLRHACDSWLVAAELCLHYSDYMQLPTIKFVTRHGIEFIQHPRSKQQGTSLIQTVNVTDRAKRLLKKWGGVKGLYYRSSAQFSKDLKMIAEEADLRDADGQLIGLQFGQGRDTGLTQRAIEGANSIQLCKMAGWSKPVYAERYIGNPLAIVGDFVKSSQSKGSGGDKPAPTQPFIRVHKAC